MKKIFTSISITCFIIALASCNNKEESKNLEAPAGMVALDLSKYGKQFFIYVPDTTINKLQVVEQSWGALEITAGKNFHISITEDPGDIELTKSDIKSNDVNVFKSYIIDEPKTLMWESQIVNPEFHFYTIQKVVNDSYVIQDVIPANGEPSSKNDIEKMLESAQKLVEKGNLKAK